MLFHVFVCFAPPGRDGNTQDLRQAATTRSNHLNMAHLVPTFDAASCWLRALLWRIAGFLFRFTAGSFVGAFILASLLLAFVFAALAATTKYTQYKHRRERDALLKQTRQVGARFDAVQAKYSNLTHNISAVLQEYPDASTSSREHMFSFIGAEAQKLVRIEKERSRLRLAKLKLDGLLRVLPKTNVSPLPPSTFRTFPYFL